MIDGICPNNTHLGLKSHTIGDSFPGKQPNNSCHIIQACLQSSPYMQTLVQKRKRPGIKNWKNNLIKNSVEY